MTPVKSTQSALSIASTANQASQATKSSSTLASNFDQFLTLLTTQLKNQSPLDPLDANQFTQQLVQFAGVEQQINGNKLLESLVANASGGQNGGSRASMVSNAVGFIGSRVTADGSRTYLANDKAKWTITAPRNGDATVTILDRNGQTVHTKNITLAAGAQEFEWNGKLVSGETAPAGQYTISINAKNALNEPMSVTSDLEGVVDSVDVTGEAPILRVGGVSVDIGNVRTIRRN